MPRNLSDFKIGRFLGKGKFGQVYIAREKKTHKIYAIKAIFKELCPNWGSEVRLQWQMRDAPYVVRLEDWFEDQKFVYLVLEYVPGDELFQVLPLPLPEVQVLAKQVALALQTCHRQGITHGDIKGENILLVNKEEIRLADFGAASDEVSQTKIRGTMDYISPQVVANIIRRDSVQYTAATDLWGLGVLIYEMLTGILPFDTGDEYETYRRIVALEYSFPKDFPPVARDLVTRLLRFKEEDRLSLVDVLDHKFFKATTE